MDVASIAAAFIAAQAGQVQTAMAAKMLRMNADTAGNAVKLLEAAQQNMNSLANVASGVGGNLDISVLISDVFERRGMSLSASSLAHSAGPDSVAISQPAASISSVVGMPNALPASFRSWNTFADGSAK